MGNRDRPFPADTTEDESRTDVSGIADTLPPSLTHDSGSSTLTDPSTNPIQTQTFFGPGVLTDTEPGVDRTPVLPPVQEEASLFRPKRDGLLRTLLAIGGLIMIGLGMTVAMRVRSAPRSTPMFGAVSPDEGAWSAIEPISPASGHAPYELPQEPPAIEIAPAADPAPKRPPPRTRAESGRKKPALAPVAEERRSPAPEAPRERGAEAVSPLGRDDPGARAAVSIVVRRGGHPEPADVFVDGIATNQAPTRIDLAPGDHQIEIKTPSGERRRRTIKVQPGHPERVLFDL